MMTSAFNSGIQSGVIKMGKPQENTVLSPLQQTPSADIYFSGLKRRPYQPKPVEFDYRAIDPMLSPEEVKDYQEAEAQWREVMEGMTPQTLKTLKARINALENIRIKNRFLPSHTLEMAAPSYDDSHIKIITARLQGKTETFKTLSHELIHALHYQKEGSGAEDSSHLRSFVTWAANKLAPSSHEAGQYNNIYHNILDVVNTKSIIRNKRKPKHFQKQLRDAINAAPIRALKNIKADLTSEAIAHGLQSTVATSRKEQQELLATTEGFKVAIQLINDRLTAAHPEG